MCCLEIFAILYKIGLVDIVFYFYDVVEDKTETDCIKFICIQTMKIISDISRFNLNCRFMQGF